MFTFSKFVALGCVLLCLSSCASLNSQFDCPMKPGVMCESLDEVNHQVDQGLLGQENTAQRCPYCIKEKTADKAQTLHVWVAPFQTPSGNEVESTFINTKLPADLA